MLFDFLGYAVRDQNENIAGVSRTKVSDDAIVYLLFLLWLIFTCGMTKFCSEASLSLLRDQVYKL